MQRQVAALQATADRLRTIMPRRSIADVVVRKLPEVARDDERWAAKFKVFKENIEHHIEEEENRMFRTPRAVLSRAELNNIGRPMKKLKAGHGR